MELPKSRCHGGLAAGLGVWPWLLVLGLACLAFDSFAAQSKWRQQAEVAFSRAADSLQAGPSDPEALWQFSRAVFDLAEFSTNATERAELARRGMEAAQSAIKLKPNLAAAHYYLALNIGQLARTRYLSALKLVGQMEREFLKARALDPKFDWAGADRGLGLLYRDAPSIGSVGSRRKAQHHLNKAVELAPTYPGNRLNLIESLLKWGDRTGAIREFKELENIWPQARETLSEPSREADWADWQARKDLLAKRLEQGLPGLKSPRDS